MLPCILGTTKPGPVQTGAGVFQVPVAGARHLQPLATDGRDISILVPSHTLSNKWSAHYLDGLIDAVDDRAVASGFVLRDTNLVLTNYHVVRDRRHITLRFPSGESYSGRVVSVDSGRDLALIEVLGRPASAGGLVLAPGEIKIGETVHAIGYPLGDTLSRQPSLVSGQVSSTVGLRDDIAQFRTTAPINPGNSGGPILNQNGQVVGIAAAGIVRTGVEAIRFGIKASAAQLMLRQAVTGSAFDITVSAAGPMPADKIFQQSAPHVVLIETR